jgi:hypothetical protein
MRLIDGSIGLRLHNTYCVIFHPDGTVTYDTGGWHTVTTMRFINEYGPTRVHSVKWDHYFSSAPIGKREPKIQKCRRCKGGKVAVECYGPGWCHPPYKSTCEHGVNEYHRKAECEHGQPTPHPLPDRECWQCKGAGTYDYGSQTIYAPWHGGRYRFDPDAPGVELDAAQYPTPVHEWSPAESAGPWQYQPSGLSKTPAKTATTHGTSVGYSDSGNILSRLIPDMESVVPYPCPCGGEDGEPTTVRNAIIHLNDAEKWTRERIADWLDTLDLNLRFPDPTR